MVLINGSGRLMKCILCEQKKAKRFCPAKNVLICAHCCGGQRVLQIPCPENCDYLRAGREREAEEYTKLVRSLDPKVQVRNRRVLIDYPNVVARLEYTLSRERFSSRDLRDRDVSQAVDILLETYRTENKGVWYERKSEDLRVDALRRELREVIESLRNPRKEEETGDVGSQAVRLPLGATIDCLEYIQSLIVAFQALRHSDSSYVDFLARFFPKEETRSSLILP
jgi:hypothetical protein